MHKLAFLALLIAAACSREVYDADLDDAAAAQAPYPKLLPVRDTLVLDTPRLSENSESELAARAQRLRNRAQALSSKPAE